MFFQNFTEISNCVSFFKLFIWRLVSCVYFDPYSYISLYRYKSCFKNKFSVHEFQIDKTRLHHNYVRKHLQKTGLHFIGNGHEGDKVFRTRADKIHVELI